MKSTRVVGDPIFSLMGTLLMPSQMVLFNVNKEQNSFDLSHASGGGGHEGNLCQPCFLIFLKKQGTKKQGPKGKEMEENRNSLLKEIQPSSCMSNAAVCLHPPESEDERLVLVGLFRARFVWVHRKGCI